MANDAKKPTTEEKGKGKAPATDDVDGKKEPKKDKDGKIIEDDKAGAEGMPDLGPTYRHLSRTIADELLQF